MRLVNIEKEYRNKNGNKKVLNNINIEFKDCGLNIILGSSGCGKTTLLNILAGDDKDFSGIIEDGLNSEYIRQEFKLLESLSVYDNLKIADEDNDKLIDFYLKSLGIFELKEHKVKKLSNGQKRLVQVIRSMLVEKDLLLCDEPTASLNQELAIKVMELFKEYSKNHIVIVVTHDIALAEKYADRLIKIDKGVIIEDKVINNKKLLVNNFKVVNKKRIFENIKFSFNYLMSRPGSSLFIIVFVFMILSFSFASISTFKTIKSQNNELIKFRERDNLVIINSIGLKDNSGKYILYDRFPRAKIEGLVDKIEDIVAIQMYNMEYGIYVPRNTDISEVLNISDEEMNSIIKKELDYRQNTYKFDDEFGVVTSGNGNNTECLYVGNNKIMNSDLFYTMAELRT